VLISLKNGGITNMNDDESNKNIFFENGYNQTISYINKISEQKKVALS
jgi:hypothetical protein